MLNSKRNLALTTVLSLSILLIGCDDAEMSKPENGPLPAVTAQPVQLRELKDQYSFVGRVQAIETFEVRSRVEGFIQAKKFVDGATVSANDVLFEIETQAYQNDIDLIKAEITGAKAILNEANLSLKRAQTLIKRGNVSQARVDELQAESSKAKAEIEKLTASLRQAQLQLSYTTIKTPISGRIGKTEYSVGNLVNPNSGLLAQVISFDPIYVSIAVSEGDLLKARRDGLIKGRAGIPVHVEFSDGTPYSHEGVVDFIDNQVDPTTDTITIRATFPNPDEILFPNQYVSMFVVRQATEKSLVVPQVAVQENQGGNFVLIIDDKNLVQVRNVELGREEGEYIVVKQGLEEGEAVVVQGLQKAKPGQEVTVKTVSDINGDGD